MYTLDTNILIYQAAGDPLVAEFLDQHRYEIFYVPSIVVTEFLSYPLMTSDAVARFQDFIRQTILINLDYAVAERAAAIRRTHKLALADAVIAASAFLTSSVLVTRNERDFRKISGLNLATL